MQFTVSSSSHVMALLGGRSSVSALESWKRWCREILNTRIKPYAGMLHFCSTHLFYLVFKLVRHTLRIVRSSGCSADDIVFRSDDFTVRIPLSLQRREGKVHLFSISRSYQTINS